MGVAPGRLTVPVLVWGGAVGVGAAGAVAGRGGLARSVV